MNAFIQTKAINQLTVDARKQRSVTEIELNIINKEDPDSWYMTFNSTVFDSIAIKAWKCDYAKLSIKIKSADEPLRFAQPVTCNARQAFTGLLFISGNHTMKEFRALTSESKEPDQLIVTINPSIFWAHEPPKEYQKIDGGKIGFRFVIVDEKENYFLSHDPMISGPDWDRL